MTTGVLERGTPTPPGRLVFAPSDGRVIPPLSHPLTSDLPMHVAAQISMGLRFRAEWILVPALVSLRAEFNLLSPGRDKASDGSIGDTAHASSSSDHNPDESGATPYEDSDSINEVHAIDVDSSGPWPPGVTMAVICNIIAERHRTGRDDRLQNIIYNGRIISRSWGWDSWHTYTGSNAHTQHAHFSARYLTAQESNTSAWGVALLAEAPEDEAMAFIENRMQFQAELDEWWTSRMRVVTGAVVSPNSPLGMLRRAPWNLPVNDAGDSMYQVLFRALVAAEAAKLTADKVLVKVTDDDGDLAAIRAEIDEKVTEAAEGILTGLVAAEESPQEIAELLRVALGDRAAEVGAFLAQPSTER